MATANFTFFQAIGAILNRMVDRFQLWFYSGAFTLALTFLGSLRSRTRMSHNNGIGATGHIRIVDHPEFPSHPFLQPGKTFPCRIRHAAASFLDDAMRVVRSISIKFADEDFRSPLDLELNTGKVALFWSAASFLRFAKYKKTMYGIQYHQYYRNYPAGVAGAKASMRRNPVSFTDQHYYTQTPFLFIGDDQVKRYAKYRVIPPEPIPETGHLEGADLVMLSEDQRILPGETRNRNYLKEEYAAYLNQRPARYLLQVQLHTAADDDDPEIFNCCAEWDERLHPWMDVAHMEIQRTLSWEDSCKLTFTMSNMPKGLGMIPAKSIYDYNSLNYMRLHSDMARRARFWAIRWWGCPPEIPDDDDRNQ